MNIRPLPQTVLLAIWMVFFIRPLQGTENYVSKQDRSQVRSLPNIILIYTDDQGFGDASCLNPDSKFQTPHLDRLAREGICFTDAHCSDTVCTPSRYGLLTGRYGWRTRKKTGVMGAEGECLIADQRMTIASLLRDHGYRTAMVGKWHLGMDFPGTPDDRDWSQPVTDMPLDKGFDYFYGIPASLNYGVLAWFEGRQAAVPPVLFTAKKPNRLAIDDYRIMPPYQQTPEQTRELLNKPGMEIAEDFVDSECLTRFTDKSIEWLKQASSAPDSKPFFLYLPYTSPHKPVIPLPAFRGQGAAGAYGEFMIETDHHVGRILDYLDQSGLAENTMVIFSSDNGPENTWRERIQRFAHHSNGIYREGKRSIYEGGHRVPFFVRWPAGIRQPGRCFAGLICQTDVMATVANVVGASLPSDAGEDSFSFYDVLVEPETKSTRERPPVIHHASNGQFAIRKGDFKLVMPHKRKQKAELFNLANDPGETSDILGQHPDTVQKLTEEISRIVCNGRSTRGPKLSNDTGYWNDLAWLTEAEYDRLTNLKGDEVR